MVMYKYNLHSKVNLDGVVEIHLYRRSMSNDLGRAMTNYEPYQGVKY